MGVMNKPQQHRHNNFDALRISAAFLVLFSHQYALTGLPEPKLLGSISLGTLGVLIFFSISGFLVSQSWRQDPHAGRFLAKRFLRIWPGLATFTLLAAFVLGPLVTTLTFRDYVLGVDFLEFFNNLKLFSVRHDLPGVFESNPFPKAVNGSLWTIPIEVRCYLVLLLFGIFGFAKKRYLAVICTVTFGIYHFLLAPDPTNHQFHFALYFFSGVCLDLVRADWEERAIPCLVAVCVFATVLYLINEPKVGLLFFVVSFSIFIGTRSTPILSRFGRYGDISYGVYVYAFAVQQTVLWMVGKSYPFTLGLLISASITTFCALLSWHFIESPALRLKSRLRRTPMPTSALR